MSYSTKTRAIRRKTPMVPKPEQRQQLPLTGVAVACVIVTLLIVISTRLSAPTELKVERAPAVPTIQATHAPTATAAPAPTAEPASLAPLPTQPPEPVSVPVALPQQAVQPVEPVAEPVAEPAAEELPIIQAQPCQPAPAPLGVPECLPDAPVYVAPLRDWPLTDCPSEHGRCAPPPCMAEHGRCKPEDQ